MAHSSPNQYLQQLEDAINGRDGATSAELLSFRHPHIASPKLHRFENPEGQCEQWFEQPYDEMIAGHLKCIQCVANHDFIEAYAYQSVVVQSFNKIFQSHKDDNWALPIMYAVTLDLRLFANNADVQLSKKGKGKPGEKLEKAADTLMGCFRICAADSRASLDDSKKWGMLYLVNQLFKIYFKTNNLQLCKPLIRAIDSSSFKDQFSISQRVTYRYYVGRKAMFDSDFKSAEEFLTFAFQRCHRASRQNKRLILIYLLPVKMLLGQMPKISLLKKYDLMQFADVSQAVIEGNLKLLNSAIEAHEIFFAKCGVYLIVDKLKIITYRNLFKRVHMITSSFQLSIEKFVSVLTFLDIEDVDSAEVECILANLIHQGYIKGYISHQHQKLVISKQNPFPPLSSFLC
ncbi:PCI domain-containing protein 2-like [Asterias rubens]|uniref:PCI domain-containing protein 2-like n=1 Tax=Asterias rubens TaxID=7604 RepID=UPI0014555A50|nr:PCI domain-containing protein 2-like [Asterias rubens]